MAHKNMLGLLLISMILFFKISSCTQKEDKKWVGDIVPNLELDGDSFTPCNGDVKIYQYFHFDSRIVYQGEKRTLDREFFDKYKAVESTQSGLIRIRFVVNCEGKSGRFRIIGMDDNYQEQQFDKAIIDQLMQITQELDGWTLKSYNEQPVDYYMYLIFKIKEGNLIEIMP